MVIEMEFRKVSLSAHRLPSDDLTDPYGQEAEEEGQKDVQGRKSPFPVAKESHRLESEGREGGGHPENRSSLPGESVEKQKSRRPGE
jgi:hypothetical protein